MFAACLPAVAANPLPRALPEAEGVDSRGVLALVGRLEAKVDAVHSLMLVRHGRVVAEGWWAPYAADDVHVTYSVTKSFVSTAVGMAADDGLLDIDDRVVDFFPEIAPAEPAKFMAQMRVRDLLTMTSGHANDMMDHLRARRGDDWTACFLETNVEAAPGHQFHYNSAASYLLAAIVQKVTDRTVEDFLRPRLFEPLGIDRTVWGKNAEGVSGPGDLSVTTEELAKFGLLYLHKGVWEGRRLLSEHWVTNATSWQTATTPGDGNWNQGYGFQFWMNKGPGYRADGSLGQFCFVMPELDAVLVILSGTTNTNEVMESVWGELVPAMHDAPLPADAAAHDALARKLASLTLPVVAGAGTSPAAAAVSGVEFLFPENKQGLAWARLDFGGARPAITFADGDGEHRIECGVGGWVRARTGFKKRVNDLFDTPEQGIAACGAWVADDVFLAKLCFDETPYILSAKFTFTGGQLRLEQEFNVRWGERVQPTLLGTAGAKE